MKTFVTKWSMEFPQQLNTTIIIWRSAPMSPDILVLVMMMAIKWCFWYAKYSWTVAIYATRNPTRYPEFFPLPYPNPTRSQKALLVSLWLSPKTKMFPMQTMTQLARFGVLGCFCGCWCLEKTLLRMLSLQKNANLPFPRGSRKSRRWYQSQKNNIHFFHKILSLIILSYMIFLELNHT